MGTRKPAEAVPVPLVPALVAPLPRAPEDARADRLDEGVWCLRLPLPYRYTRSVNCFLLADADGWTLLDCGSAVGHGWEALLHGLAAAGVEPQAISKLVLTHLHPDHASLAGRVADELGCPVWRFTGPESSYDALREQHRPLGERRAAARAEGVPAPDLDAIVDTPLAGDGVQPRPGWDRILEPDDVLVAGGGEWRAIPALGHSAQQMMLHDARRRWLIAADAAYPEIRPFLEWGHTPEPYAEYVAGLDAIEELAPRLLLPSHGRPDDRPAARVASARAALAGTRARIQAHVVAEPRSAYDVTCRVAGDIADPDVRGSWLSVCLAVLEDLVRGGEAVCERGADGVRRFRLP
jgi:glyoxylase-like metal-dependent hydrolase (beta-lactamase superfamily II)